MGDAGPVRVFFDYGSAWMDLAPDRTFEDLVDDLQAFMRRRDDARLSDEEWEREMQRMHAKFFPTMGAVVAKALLTCACCHVKHVTFLRSPKHFAVQWPGMPGAGSKPPPKKVCSTDPDNFRMARDVDSDEILLY